MNNLSEQHKDIGTNVHVFYEDEKWLLPEVTGLMTAKAYKDKKAQPLVNSLKEVIKGMIIKVVNLTQKYNSLMKEKKSLA